MRLRQTVLSAYARIRCCFFFVFRLHAGSFVRLSANSLKHFQNHKDKSGCFFINLAKKIRQYPGNRGEKIRELNDMPISSEYIQCN